MYSKLLNLDDNTRLSRQTKMEKNDQKISEDKRDLIIGTQMKYWQYDITLQTIKEEHEKNLNAISKYLCYGSFKWRRFITLVITTAEFNGNLEDIPQDCLLICNANYRDFFGDPFSSHAILHKMINNNPNYASQETLLKKYHFSEDVSYKISNKRPYNSPEQLCIKVPEVPFAIASKFNYCPLRDDDIEDINYPKRQKIEH